MKLRQITLALAVAAAASSAHAALWTGNFQTSNGTTTHDGVLINIDGLEVYSQGTAAFFCISGSCGAGTQINPVGTSLAVGDKVRTYYQGIVSNFTTGVSSPNLNYPGQAGSYEMTVAIMFDEEVVGGILVSGVFANAVLKPIATGSRFGIYFDDNPATFANISAGTGFTNGTPVYEASLFDGFAGGSTNYTINFLAPGGPSAFGVTTLIGKTVNAAPGADAGNPAVGEVGDQVGFMPTTPDGFITSATVQYSSLINPNYKTSNFFDNANGWTPVAVDKDYTVRADGNLDFQVPEPTTLALLGLGLAGLGISLRRRAA